MHDICIECTANNLKQNQDEEGTLDEFQIQCPKCNVLTSIEEETVHTIILLMEKEDEEEGVEVEEDVNENEN